MCFIVVCMVFVHVESLANVLCSWDLHMCFVVVCMVFVHVATWVNSAALHTITTWYSLLPRG